VVTRRTTLLVVGGSGFLGSAIAAAARRAGFDVHVTWRTTPPPDGVTAHRAQLDEPAEAERVISAVQPDVVVNALGGPHRPVTAEQRRAAWRDAPMAASALLEACRDRRCRFVHLASSHELAPSTDPYDESSAIGPVSLRGIAANAATETVRLWATETAAPTVILRPFSVYGPGEPEDRVVPAVLRAALTGTPFRMASGSGERDFVFADDIAHAVIAACRGDVVGEFNLGTGIGTDLPELVAAAEIAVGRTIEVDADGFDPRPWDRAHWVADPSAAAMSLGWKAETSLVEGLRKYRDARR
jgi:nucleoside-diphosphate-sugar epimerase